MEEVVCGRGGERCACEKLCRGQRGGWGVVMTVGTYNKHTERPEANITAKLLPPLNLVLSSLPLPPT